jgi:peptidoglycan hydrolase CwlO-like protein
MGDGEKAQIGMLIESNNEIKSAIVDLARGMTSLVAFQAKAEQQHLNLTEFKKETKVEIKSHDERLESG